MLNAFFQIIEPEPERFHSQQRQQKDRSQQSTKKQSNPQESKKANSSSIQEDLNDSYDSDNSNSSSSSSMGDSEGVEVDPFLIQKKLAAEQKRHFNQVNPEVIISVLSKKVEADYMRDANEISLLQQALIHNSFFRKIRRKITQTLYQEIFQEIHLETFRPMDPVFHYGEKANKFYIIISGEVCILTPLQRTLEPTNTEPDQLPDHLDSHRSNASTTQQQHHHQHQHQHTHSKSHIPPVPAPAPSAHGHSHAHGHHIQTSGTASQQTHSSRAIHVPKVVAVEQQQQQENKDQTDPMNFMQKIAHNYPNCMVIKKLNSGESFGEIGLYMDRSRSATVVCKSHCEMVVLSKAAFQRILGAFFCSQVEDKQMFFKGIPLFQGYTFSFIANLIMNVRRRVYQYGDVIYEEGTNRMRLYFIRSGEVELSKKVELKKAQQNLQIPLPKSQQRIVVASKFANEWFGEIEIMQKIPRYTRARCVSSKLEVYHLSGRKVFQHLNQEQFLSTLKKQSNLLHQWRDDHFRSMVDNIYANKDPLSKTFKNLKMGKKLFNQKFKEEFLNADVASICQPDKPEEAQDAAKKVCFSKIKKYVNKITDVIGTISDNKFNPPTSLRGSSSLQSLPNIHKHATTPLFDSQKFRLEESLQNESSVQDTLLSPKQPSITSLQIISPKSIPINSHSLLSPKLLRPQRKSQLSRPTHDTSNNEISYIEHSENNHSKRYSIQSDKLPLLPQFHAKYKSFSGVPSAQDIDDTQVSQISSPNLQKSEKPDHKHQTKSMTQLDSASSRVFLEGLYDKIIQQKNSTSLTFNESINQRMLKEGMERKNRQLHQKREHLTNFSNLHNVSSSQSLQPISRFNDKVQKIDLLKKLNLQDVLAYKYIHPLRESPYFPKKSEKDIQEK